MAVLHPKNQPLILLFDQFEQFFVHYQSAEARQPFVIALKDWYDDEEIAVKILMSFRFDLFYQQYEIQQVLNYSLDSRNNIKLKKFSPSAQNWALFVHIGL